MQVSKTLRILILATAALLAAGQAFAQVNNPVGLWTIQSWTDNAAGMPAAGVQDICFLGGPTNGTWFSTTFPGWTGLWFQKGAAAAGNGDHLRMLGNYANNVGNDAMEVDFVNGNLMAGPWTEWRDNFVFVAWTRATLTRIGTCAGPPPTGVITSTDPSDTVSASPPS
jgi:hypothetical protein